MEEIKIREEAAVIDEQYLMENCGVTMEELEGVDVTDFVERWVVPRRIRRGFLDDAEIGMMLTSYKQCREILDEVEERQRNAKDDYAWLFDEKERGGYKDKYLEDITVIAIWASSGMYRESVIYDLENQVYYFGELVDVTEDYSQATASGELRDEDVEAIRKLAEEAQIDDWPAKSGWIRPQDNDYSTFVMRIATSDGSVYGYRGERLFPSPFVKFYKGMKEQVGL
ncbi:MAG: hypothetical protein NC089_12670 [Bacteroides sp.]|nr:hypothetical protein [Bacteroides sp.]MCM1550935.1 hypothetical protein [Clostridium sp.]